MSVNSSTELMPDNPESNAESRDDDPVSQSSTKSRRVLIGSQRDAADTSLRANKPLLNATVNPKRIAQTLKVAPQREQEPQESSKTTSTPPATPAPETVSDSAAQPIASTPAVRFDEPATQLIPDPVLDSSRIDEELEAALEDLQMDSLLGKTAAVEEIELDSRVRGIVSRIHNENVFFSLKGHHEGVASMRQFKSPPKEGTMIDVIVTSWREEEGLYEVLLPGAAMSVADWSDLKEGAVVDAKITGSNTGGLECSVNNIRGFIPASQIEIGHVDNFGDYVNQKYQCVVTEVNPARKKLVLSRRAILERDAQAKKAELMKSLSVGDMLEGVVTRIMDFGAFVDIGGVEGLVHVSKLSWDRVTHPKEILIAGQRIRVKVEKIAEDSGKIGLSFRDTQVNPWKEVVQKYPVGSVVDGTVTRLAQFGAFVKLEPGIEGLVHISELAHHRVVAVKNVVNNGDKVSVKILAVDPAAQKIGLSLKATMAKPEPTKAKKEEETSEPLRELAVKKTNQPLKGGRSRGAGGEEFGLNW